MKKDCVNKFELDVRFNDKIINIDKNMTEFVLNKDFVHRTND